MTHDTRSIHRSLEFSRDHDRRLAAIDLAMYAILECRSLFPFGSKEYEAVETVGVRWAQAVEELHAIVAAERGQTTPSPASPDTPAQ